MTLGDRCDHVIALIDEVLDAGLKSSTGDTTSKHNAVADRSSGRAVAFDSKLDIARG